MSWEEGFFTVARRSWGYLCDRHDINMATSYLCIAAGTGKDNHSSSWSAKAIESHTGMHRSRASQAIENLIAEGYLRRGERSSRTRPRYEFLLPFRSETVEPSEELIWLPNTLVTGTPAGEPSPVRRLRSRGDEDALRLLIDLYQDHNLSAEGGINRRVLRQEYDREKCGERGRHFVWAFKKSKQCVSFYESTEYFWNEKGSIWRPLSTLRDEGLLTVVPHLVENSNLECEPIHGFGWDGAGEHLELQLGSAADKAARYIMGETRHDLALERGFEIFAPVWDTHQDVQMVGVFRLTYRPHTRLTREWNQRLQSQASEWMSIYEKIGPPWEQEYLESAG